MLVSLPKADIPGRAGAILKDRESAVSTQADGLKLKGCGKKIVVIYCLGSGRASGRSSDCKRGAQAGRRRNGPSVHTKANRRKRVRQSALQDQVPLCFGYSQACITKSGVSVWKSILRAMLGLNMRARMLRR